MTQRDDTPLDDRHPSRAIARRRTPATGPVEDRPDAFRPDQDDDGPSTEDLARFADVTIPCPACGTRVMDDVAICWKCGHAIDDPVPQTSTPPTWAMVVGVGLILVIIALAIL